jgi:hypothetical protein
MGGLAKQSFQTLASILADCFNELVEPLHSNFVGGKPCTLFRRSPNTGTGTDSAPNAGYSEATTNEATDDRAKNGAEITSRLLQHPFRKAAFVEVL